jgi:uncharacterized protein with von Willebrand factor type A (vWA) domain
MGIAYKTTKWSDSLWSSHVRGSPMARSLINNGVKKQAEFSLFTNDLHSRLYLRSEPEKLDEAPEWATKLHEATSELNEWHQLRQRCKSNGFAAGIATEQLLSSLVELVSEQPQSPDTPQQRPRGGNGKPGGDVPTPGDQPTPEEIRRTLHGGIDKAKVRRQLRRAIRQAKQEVDKATSEMESLDQVLGFPGSEVGKPETAGDIEKIRQAYAWLKGSRQLQQITKLAGRLQRLAASKKRTKVKTATGGIKGITLSGDLNRVLPTELAGLRGSRMQRLMTLKKIMERKALSYLMQGEEAQDRGPIIMLIDKSSSMYGTRDTWASAIGLSVLNTATEQKRTWHMIGFNAAITHEKTVLAGQGTINDVCDVFVHGCSGGTAFDPPISRALELLQNSKTLKKADVIVVTDGEANLSNKFADQCRKLTKEHGVSFYVIGVGNEASLKGSLSKIATFMVKLNTTNTNDPIVPIINLEE